MGREIIEAVEAIEKEKNISRSTMFEAIRTSLRLAYKNHFSKAGTEDYDKSREYDNVEVVIDEDTGDYQVFSIKEVVEKDPENDTFEISLADAKAIKPEAETGDTVKIPMESKKFSRIAASMAKNTIVQVIREGEKLVHFDRCRKLEGTVMEGAVYKKTMTGYLISFGFAEALLGFDETIPGENISVGDMITVYIKKAMYLGSSTGMIASRVHPDYVRALIEYTIPEVKEGWIDIYGVSRVCGKSSTIAVGAEDGYGYDPVQVCEGMQGMRSGMISKNLAGEDIKFVRWDSSLREFVKNLIRPYKIASLKTDKKGKTVTLKLKDRPEDKKSEKEIERLMQTVSELTGYRIKITEDKAENEEKEVSDLEKFRQRSDSFSSEDDPEITMDDYLKF